MLVYRSVITKKLWRYTIVADLDMWYRETSYHGTSIKHLVNCFLPFFALNFLTRIQAS